MKNTTNNTETSINKSLYRKFYRIYGKHVSGKKFKPFDFGSGKFVNNLIYASYFSASMKSELDKEIQFLNDNNPEYTFELRKF